MATSTQEQRIRLAPFQEEFLADIFESARTLTGEGTTLPFARQQLAALSPAQQQAASAAMAGVGSFAPFLETGRAATTAGIAGAMGAGISPTSYQAFMDPFLEDVVQQAQMDIARQGDIQRQRLGAEAVGRGAFGGSRRGIAEAELSRNILDQQARTGSQLRTAGFAQAQAAAQQAAQQQLRQAQLAGQLGVSTAGLGQLGQQMGVQDINTLLGIGGLQQQQSQRALDVERANQLAEQALPFQRIGFMSDIFRGVPALQQTFSTVRTPPPSRSSQLLGLGIAGLGAIGQAGGFGNFFGGPRPMGAT
tara:strand:+ start:1605 stop:2522 length:918 start_codon:yes stop_codon:yes gene_type:complete